MKFLQLFTFLLICSCTFQESTSKSTKKALPEQNLASLLDSIWHHEQDPIRKRDSLMEIYGAEAEELKEVQELVWANHAENIVKIKSLLDTQGWPEPSQVGERGMHTICNVLQHSDQETREYYLPMMKQAVLNQKLEARFLVRAEDRLATDRGELQIYGGQMKYYPETKSFNVWPVYDPVNIDKRRAAIGLGPIAEHLKMRFDFEWDLEEQIVRSQAFERERLEFLRKQSN